MKRAFDIVFAAGVLLLLLPLLAAVVLAVKLTSRGPVFFVQVRIGRDLAPFRLYKFRTMVVDAPRLGPGITAGTDPRITRLGRLLRRAKLDELPQLWNVLKGDMSVVGPRPEVRRYVSRYREQFRRLLRVRPGLTDPSSLRFIDEAEVLGAQTDPESYYVNVLLPEKIRLSLEYVEHASLRYDLEVITATLLRLLTGRAQGRENGPT